MFTWMNFLVSFVEKLFQIMFIVYVFSDQVYNILSHCFYFLVLASVNRMTKFMKLECFRIARVSPELASSSVILN